MTYTPGILTGKHEQGATDANGDRLPAVGRARITPETDRQIVRTLDGAVIISGSWVVDLDETGTYASPVPPQGEVDPINVTYRVDVELDHANIPPVTGVAVAPDETVNVNEWTSVVAPESEANAAHDAEVSRQAAELAASAAALSETGATQSEQAAAGSAGAAAQSKADAAQSETNADQSEAAAAGSAGAAAQSEANAHQSELNAAASAAAAALASGPTIMSQLVPNPIFQTSTTGWSNTNASLARLGVGQARWTCTLAGAGNASIYPPGPGSARFPVAANQYVHAAIRVTALRDMQYSSIVTFFDAGSNSLGTVSVNAGAWSVINAGETAVMGVVDALAPANATTAQVRFLIFDKGAGTAAAADFMDVAGGSVYVTSQRIGWSPQDPPILYGGLPGVRWAGAAHASVSEIYAPPVALLAGLGKSDAPLRGMGPPASSTVGYNGDTYRDLLETNGAVLWRKSAGAWKCVEGDTGWRTILAWDASGTITTGAFGGAGWKVRPGQPGSVKVRRVNERVYCIITNATVAASNTADPVTVIPNGFAAVGTDLAFCQIVQLNTGAPNTCTFLPSLARIGNTTLTLDAFIISSGLTWPTAQAWAATLPGIAG